jgi:hypothetical protein
LQLALREREEIFQFKLGGGFDKDGYADLRREWLRHGFFLTAATVGALLDVGS